MHSLLFFFFSFFKSWDLKVRSESLDIFRISNTTMVSNLNSWFFPDSKKFMRKRKPLDLHFWALWAPISKYKPLILFKTIITAAVSNFRPWFLLDLKKFYKALNHWFFYLQSAPLFLFFIQFGSLNLNLNKGSLQKHQHDYGIKFEPLILHRSQDIWKKMWIF